MKACLVVENTKVEMIKFVIRAANDEGPMIVNKIPKVDVRVVMFIKFIPSEILSLISLSYPSIVKPLLPALNILGIIFLFSISFYI